jgi:DNA polymerase-3 subunit beta
MKVTIAREALLRALGRTQGVVDKRHSMAVLTNALLEAEDGALSVIATDLEVSLKQAVPAKVATAGRAAASARTLFEIVRESSTQDIQLRTLENQWVEVSYGRSNFKLMGINPEEHPGMPASGRNGAKSVRVQLDAGDLAEMIRKTVFAVSTDDTRSNLAGVFLTKGAKKGTLRMVATDGHRLAMVDRQSTGAAVTDGVILPRKGLAELGKLLPEETGAVTLTLSASEASVEVGDCSLSVRLVEGTFPDYQKVIPENTPRELSLGRDELLQTLRRVSILSSERARGVRFKLEKGSLAIVASNPDMGEASEELAIEYRGDAMEVGFNARYLLEVLSVLPEASKVEIGLGDELSPGVIRGDDEGYCYVVMPMRI